MTYDLKLEHQILEVIKNFPHDLSSPGDSFTPIYPESIQFLPALDRYKPFGQEGKWRMFESHLRFMREQGWVEGQEWKNGWGTQNLTTAGLARLDWFRSNTLFRRSVRIIGAWLDKAMTSIFLPIVAAVITVWVMQYVGLAAKVTP